MRTMTRLIYLDHNATTACAPQVVEAMLPYFSESYGNPANGLHVLGRQAARAVDEARHQVADLIGAGAGEIVFTSGATESNNLAILGLARALKALGRHRIVTSVIEHRAVLGPCETLEKEGFEIVYLPVDVDGVVSLDAASQVINQQTLLVSIQAANNETGVIQPVAKIAELSHQYGALVHCDAAQALGKLHVAVEDWGVDLLSLSGHKFYGPKGVGALYVRKSVKRLGLQPLVYGGGQENGLRPGTLNVPGIVGLGEAAHLADKMLDEDVERMTRLRDAFEHTLMQDIVGLRINGGRVSRLPNTSSLIFPDVDADALLLNMPELLLGTGSACHSGAIEPSHVLTAMGLSRREAHQVVRMSLGRFTQADDMIKAAAEMVKVWRALVRLN